MLIPIARHEVVALWINRYPFRIKGSVTFRKAIQITHAPHSRDSSYPFRDASFYNLRTQRCFDYVLLKYDISPEQLTDAAGLFVSDGHSAVDAMHEIANICRVELAKHLKKIKTHRDIVCTTDVVVEDDIVRVVVTERHAANLFKLLMGYYLTPQAPEVSTIDMTEITTVPGEHRIPTDDAEFAMLVIPRRGEQPIQRSVWNAPFDTSNFSKIWRLHSEHQKMVAALRKVCRFDIENCFRRWSAA